MLHNIFKKQWIIFIAILFIIACKKEDLSVSSKEDLIEKLQAELDQNDMTSMSFAVVKDDSLILNESLGWADVENNRAATPDTRYLIASISKPITGIALMQLYEQNLFDLEDDINDFLPFSIRNPNYPSEKITFKMLLAHVSSISDNHYFDFDLYCYGNDCSMSLASFFENVFTNGGQYFSANNFSNYAPGTNEDYSNLGMALVGYLVERIANQPFDEYCKNHIFLPLGMTKTEWRLANTPQNELAIPYSDDISGTNPHYTFPDYPNGGLRTTVVDLSKFLRSIMLDGHFNDVNILTSATMDLMKTLQFNSEEQGLVFYFEYFNGKRVLGHSGGEMGVTTEMYFDPVTNVGAIIFNNDDDTRLDDAMSLLFAYGELF